MALPWCMPLSAVSVYSLMYKCDICTEGAERDKHMQLHINHAVTSKHRMVTRNGNLT